MDELIDQFLIEGCELVQQASDDLLALERNPADAGRIDSAFRAVHTLKGSVGLFDFAPMGEMLHNAEDLLGAVRDGRLAATKAIVGVLLDCIGASDAWIDSIGRTGALPSDAELSGRALQAAIAPYLGGGARPVAVLAEVEDGAWVAQLVERNRDALPNLAPGQAITAFRYMPSPDCFFLGDDPLALVRSIPDLIALEIGGREAWATENFDPFVCNLVFLALTSASVDDVRLVFRFVPDQAVVAETQPDLAEPGSLAVAEGGREGAVRTLRVDAARIDALADIIGELVVAKNGLSHLARRAADIDAKLARELTANQAGIDRLVGDLHRAVTRMRMIPLARTFQRFPRLVRDIAGRLGKSVTFSVSGDEVEADKSIVDGIFEPLLHVLRNAVDHGIEDAGTRGAAQKPAEGRIRLEARRAGDQIVISVIDDGAGIDLDRVRRVAKDRKLMDAGAIDALDDAAALDLIFAPGFSTASEVTDVSGRGVGMDVVRSAVEAMGGRVLVTSTRGAGATIQLLLPRAFVIHTIMTVRVGDERFGVPIETVQETMRVAANRIVRIREGEAFVVRNRTVPLLCLADLLGLPGVTRSDDIRVLIATSGDERVAIEVDGFAERFDVVLRPMQGLLSGMPGVLGTALLGDGQVLMVLDLPELIG